VAGRFVVQADKNGMRVYNKALAFQWQWQHPGIDPQGIQTEFSSIFATDATQHLWQVHAKTGLAKQIDGLPAVTHYQVGYPFIIAQSVSGNVVVYDRFAKAVIWEKKQSCRQVMLLAGKRLVGCATATDLVLYRARTGQVLKNLTALNANWTLIGKTQAAAFFEYDSRLVHLDTTTYQVADVTLTGEGISTMVRQKERLVWRRAAGELALQDGLSKQDRWVYPLTATPSKLTLQEEWLAIQVPSQTVVLDTFTGEPAYIQVHTASGPPPDCVYWYPQSDWMYCIGSTGSYRAPLVLQ